MMSAPAQPKTILLVFIHGFKGDHTTFAKFPHHLATQLQERLHPPSDPGNACSTAAPSLADLKSAASNPEQDPPTPPPPAQPGADAGSAPDKPSPRVIPLIYPAYDTRGDLRASVSKFRAWLSEKTEEAAADGVEVGVIIVGHSMGGIVGGDAILGWGEKDEGAAGDGKGEAGKDGEGEAGKQEMGVGGEGSKEQAGYARKFMDSIQTSASGVSPSKYWPQSLQRKSQADKGQSGAGGEGAEQEQAGGEQKEGDAKRQAPAAGGEAAESEGEAEKQQPAAASEGSESEQVGGGQKESSTEDQEPATGGEVAEPEQLSEQDIERLNTAQEVTEKAYLEQKDIADREHRNSTRTIPAPQEDGAAQAQENASAPAQQDAPAQPPPPQQETPPEPHPSSSSKPAPHILGLLTFDTPFLGIAPGVVRYGAESHFQQGKYWYDNAMGAWNVAQAVGLGGSTTRAAAATGATWGKWAKVAAYGGATGAVAVAGAAAYANYNKISSGISWAGDHLEFVGCLARGEELRRRFGRLVALSEGGIAPPGAASPGAAHEEGGADDATPGSFGLAVLYTLLTKDKGAAERTFCNFPRKERGWAPFWTPAVNPLAAGEVDAHVGMFGPELNPNYEVMTVDAADRAAAWVPAQWRGES